MTFVLSNSMSYGCCRMRLPNALEVQWTISLRIPVVPMFQCQCSGHSNTAAPRAFLQLDVGNWRQRKSSWGRRSERMGLTFFLYGGELKDFSFCGGHL
jgi:hypothetical protein